ncbi:MAG TPA: carboxymuconolactone decarboxylase family protein [Acidimicrobiales bacterium]|jgi:AhpD family alkylhydroperoxidase|nr:carboxymuconolactone decarboxylase family protein [Acidimicrobiales bacterium]
MAAGTGPPNLFTTLGRHRGLFWGWLHFAGRLMLGGRLSRRHTELAILRVAHLRGCRYELDHHTRLSRRAGLTDQDRAALAMAPSAAGWPPQEAAILAAVDSLHGHQDLDDDTWDDLRTWLDDEQVIELCLLVGHYEMLATTIAALRIEPDRAR